MSAALASGTAVDRHHAITVAALMATFMETVNISLPNAAVPHIQGTLSMADDEVGWVFTAYITAGATMLPMSRWLANRYGRKTVYQLALAYFRSVCYSTHWRPRRFSSCLPASCREPRAACSHRYR